MAYSNKFTDIQLVTYEKLQKSTMQTPRGYLPSYRLHLLGAHT